VGNCPKNVVTVTHVSVLVKLPPGPTPGVSSCTGSVRRTQASPVTVPPWAIQLERHGLSEAAVTVPTVTAHSSAAVTTKIPPSCVGVRRIVLSFSLKGKGKPLTPR
jgi:hypothetical protein